MGMKPEVGSLDLKSSTNSKERMKESVDLEMKKMHKRKNPVGS